MDDTRDEADEQERGELLAMVQARLEMPMVALGFVWLALLVVELVRGLEPWLQTLGTAIWVIFLIDFGLRFVLAPRKLVFLRESWIGVFALILPALRVFAVFRAVKLLRMARTMRGLRLVRLGTSINRGMKAVKRAMAQRGVGYVASLTGLVAVAGAAGMYAFEQGPDGKPFEGYLHALWWTAMLLTTMGSDYWPTTPEGRILCLALAIYGFAVFGYITATIATFFIGQDRERKAA